MGFRRIRSQSSFGGTHRGGKAISRAGAAVADIDRGSRNGGGRRGNSCHRPLRINVDPWFSRMFLAPHLPRFLGRHPLLSLEISVSNYREEMMTGVDVAVRFGPPQLASLVGRRLLDTRVLTCAAPAYLKQHGEPAAPYDLVDHEVVLFRDPQKGRPFPWEFHRKGKVLEIPVRGRMLVDDPSTTIRHACPASVCSRASSWVWVLTCEVASLRRSLPDVAKSGGRCSHTGTCHQPRSGHSWISYRKSSGKTPTA
jgi:DNA-binding transcriptional LysR family regulator